MIDLDFTSNPRRGNWTPGPAMPAAKPRRAAGLYAVFGTFFFGYRWTCNVCGATAAKTWDRHDEAEAMARAHFTLAHDETYPFPALKVVPA